MAGLTTVVMTLIIGATRVLFAMCRDWLLPPRPGQHQPARPARPCAITRSSAALVALIGRPCTPIGKLEEMVNIGTLSAFTLVSMPCRSCAARRPDLKRAFTVPFSPVLPVARRPRSAST